MGIHQLRNTVQPYAWGSTTAIPQLLGRDNPRQLPQAELWMGAHPLGCSLIDSPTGPQPLDQFLASDPKQLGQPVSRRFGRLPYLFKVLAAAQPLSLQAHPSKKQAEEGWRREQTSGPPLNDPRRNYKDDNHKPEILLALSEFSSMSGLRPIDQIRDNLTPILPQLDFHDHRSFFSSLMQLAPKDSAAALEQLPSFLRPGIPEHQWIQRLTKLHPDDITVLSPLYLNLIQLQPGQAIYLPARVLHAYLEGTGIELMANSDNVLRGGLTNKHRDIPELLRVLDFSEHQPQVLTPQAIDDWRERFVTPADEFVLQRWQLRSRHQLDCQRSPTIILVLKGTVTTSCDGDTLTLTRGESAFISAEHDGVTLAGSAQVVAALVPVAGSTP